MTELIRQQLLSMGIMGCCGIAAGCIYQVFYLLRTLHVKIRLLDFLLEVVSLILTGYCISAFLYYSSWGKIELHDAVSFFAGLWLWRRVYGEKGEQTPGIREESQSAGYQHSTGSPEGEEKGKTGKQRKRRDR